jgi:hypothetical protein
MMCIFLNRISYAGLLEMLRIPRFNCLPLDLPSAEGLLAHSRFVVLILEQRDNGAGIQWVYHLEATCEW